MLLAVYGTLRRHGVNYGYYLSGFEPLSTEVLEGFDMFSLGAYPYVAHGEGSVLIEVYDVTLAAAAKIIAMEVNAGYRFTEVETSQGEAGLFYFGNERHQAYAKRNWCDRVDSGDWLTFKRQIDVESENYGIRQGQSTSTADEVR